MSSFIPQEFSNLNDRVHAHTISQKCRSIALVPDGPSEFSRSYQGSASASTPTLLAPVIAQVQIQSPVTRILSPSKPLDIHASTKTNKTSSRSDQKALTTGRYSFTCDINDIDMAGMERGASTSDEKFINLMNCYLGCSNEFHFSPLLQENEYDMWKGKYIDAEYLCEVEVHVHYGEKADNYKIELVKTKGDSKPFTSFFRTFKSMWLNPKTANEAAPQKEGPVLKTPPYSGGEKDMSKAFNCVFSLCDSVYFDTRVQGVKMFYKLFCQMRTANEEGLLQDNFIKTCVQRVERLIRDEFEDVTQHAIFLFKFLCDIPEYQFALVDSKALSTLFQKVSYVSEPFYDSIHVRRACASIIYILSQGHSKTLVKNLEEHVVKNWTSRVDELRFDSKIYDAGRQACENIVKNVQMF